MDFSSIFGVVGALVMIIAGQLMEGGNPKQLLQITAAMIVFGGTFGAVFVSFPGKIVIFAFKQLVKVFIRKSETPQSLIDKISELANKARKEGIVSLEQDLPTITNSFMKKALSVAIDGADVKELKGSMETEMHFAAEYAEQAPKVWESAGGFSPTVGIIGAVIGLIQVMQNLDNIEEVGKGIAVAFVATIYGVGSANLIFLPSATKIKLINQEDATKQEMILDGVSLIVEGVNPMIIRDRLAAYIVGEKKKESEEEKK